MANALNLYDPLFYAQEALIALEKSLGMAGTVHRGYEPEPQQKGSTIKINRPGVFTATDMPNAASDITPGDVTLVVDKWKGVTFALTDKELAFTKEKIIDDHIRPAAYAVADAIDQSLVGLYADVPHVVAADATNPEYDFPNLREKMFTNKVPTVGRSLMIDGAREAAYLKRALFHQANTSSDGAQTQREGFLGRKFGFDIFANQNTPAHVGGTLDGTAMKANAAVAVGAESISIKDTDGILTGTLKKGDVVTSGGRSYSVTADATAAANVITVSVTPKVRVAIALDDAITVTKSNATENIAYHRNAFALGMAPLSELGGQLGARIATIADPITGLALRSRMWYEGSNSKVFVSIDALWGVKTLDPELAVRLRV